MHFVQLALIAKPQDELACTQWCTEVGIIRRPPLCDKHNQEPTLFSRSGHGLFWRCSKCSNRIAARLGSIFQNSKLSMGKTLVAILSFALGLGIEETQQACSWSSNEPEPAKTTIVRLFTALRTRVAASMAEDDLIGGPNKIVQIDEALIGRRKYNRGRPVEGTWVLGMIDQDGRARFEVVHDRSSATLIAVITKNVAEESIIHTDEWRAYTGLASLGYKHGTVNHSERFVSADGVHTQRIESQWRQIRRKFSKGGLEHHDIPDHLAEYAWRRSCRQTLTDPFDSLLKLIQANKIELFT